MFCFFKKYFKDFSCIILFPNKEILPDELFANIRNHYVYDIDISINDCKKNFKRNFIQMLYYNEEWCKHGGHNGKSNECFSDCDNLKIYFIDKQDLKTLVECIN